MRCLLSKITLVELIVLIVIGVAIALVAFPKFLDASLKKKASEFPKQLTKIYKGEMDYHSEKGSYATTLQCLKDSVGVDVPSASRWFTYSMPTATGNAFTARATVNAPGFGAATTSDYATIDQTNTKYATATLRKYCPRWK